MNDIPLNHDPDKEPASLIDELAIERNELAMERNRLAVERNELANERTALSYARTSIMAFLTGVTLFKLYPDSRIMEVVGGVSIVVSLVVLVLGVWQFFRRFRMLCREEKKVRQAHRR